jgi:hypothetical protein
MNEWVQVLPFEVPWNYSFCIHLILFMYWKAVSLGSRVKCGYFQLWPFLAVLTFENFTTLSF